MRKERRYVMKGGKICKRGGEVYKEGGIKRGMECIYKEWRFKKRRVCAKVGDKYTHHPHLNLDWVYPPTYMERESPVQLIFT